jgi:hypothetical protein
MPQHEECNLFVEDFEGEALFENCRACKILGGDNWNCIGASHKRKDTGKLIIPLTPVNSTSLLCLNSISWLTPYLTILFASFFIIAQTGGGQGELLCW